MERAAAASTGENGNGSAHVGCHCAAPAITAAAGLALGIGAPQMVQGCGRYLFPPLGRAPRLPSLEPVLRPSAAASPGKGQGRRSVPRGLTSSRWPRHVALAPANVGSPGWSRRRLAAHFHQGCPGGLQRLGLVHQYAANGSGAAAGSERCPPGNAATPCDSAHPHPSPVHDAPAERQYHTKKAVVYQSLPDGVASVVGSECRQEVPGPQAAYHCSSAAAAAETLLL